MAGNNSIQFLRGTSAQRKANSQTLLAGQPFYETDTNKLYVGTGRYSLNSGYTTNVNSEYLHVITFQSKGFSYDYFTFVIKNYNSDKIFNSKPADLLDLYNKAFDAYSNGNISSETGNMVIKIPLYELDNTTYRPEESNYSLIWTFPLNTASSEFWINSNKVPDDLNPAIDSLDEAVWVL